MCPIDPEFFDEDAVRAALAARDIGALYGLLRRIGVSQRRIAELTGQSQSEVSEILHGRQVLNVRLLERIADGFGMSRKRMGLSYCEDTPPGAKEVTEPTKRRVLIAAGMTTALRQATQPLVEPRHLALPAAEPLPPQLDLSHVRAVRLATDHLRAMARHQGGQGTLFTDAVAHYTRWMHVPAPDAIKALLAAALAELHTEAGWSCYDSGMDGSGHFTRAMAFADQAGDAYGIAKAAWSAGATLVRTGNPNDALKLFQCGQLCLSGARLRKPTAATPRPDDPRLPILTAYLALNSGTAYAVMQGHDQATQCLTEAHDGWTPRDASERGDMDRATAAIQLDLGQLDTAEALAATAVRNYGDANRRDRTMAKLLHAEIHIRAREPQGLALAHHALTEVRTLHSVRARRERLSPLATALATNPGTDARELARAAHNIATYGTSEAVPPTNI
ncbi:MAG: helix-turn-helix domain-containing protein [Pseudonocardiaceae bacterium]